MGSRRVVHFFCLAIVLLASLSSLAANGPTGPVQDLTGLKFTASGKTLKWRRDLLDGWTFHVQVPAGVNEVTADLDYASPATLQGGFGAGSAATAKLYVVN